MRTTTSPSGEMLRLLAIVHLLLIPIAGLADMKELVIDPLATTEHWQVGGNRVFYHLGKSSLFPSTEQAREGAEASLKLTYDFEEPHRWFVSAYHIGPAIPGRCAEVSFWLYGNGSKRPIRLSIEDARERWFERTVGNIDWEGWKRVTVPVGDGKDWRALLRRGEEDLPMLHPVNLRQIAVYRQKDAKPLDAIYLSDLRAKTDVVPADFADARLDTGREANLFYLGETFKVAIAFTSRAEQPVIGSLSAVLTDFFGKGTEVHLGGVEIPPAGSAKSELKLFGEALGTFTVAVRLTADGRERVWFQPVVVSKPLPDRPADANATFGTMFNLHTFPKEQLPLALRLNRDAGLRWTRLSFHWQEINPAPGAWIWSAQERVQGPVGKAIELRGQVFSLPHKDVLNCTDAVTIAFWARCKGKNDNWQCPIQKWGADNRRNYGVYFGKDNGQFCFSACYEKLPNAKHVDKNSGFSAWDGQWHHYAATYSAADKKLILYVDGEEKLSEELDGGALRTNQDDLRIGPGFEGGLDEMVLYRRALSPDEVASLAQKKSPPQDGLAAWWDFEEEGALIKDRSPNRLDVPVGEPQAISLARIGLEHGIKTLGLLGFPPQWASTAPAGTERYRQYKPKLDAWAEYVENVTRRYKDLVQHWEIWNEPNILVFWEPEPNAKDYFDVLKVAYAAAKRGNPDCTVIMPGLAGPGQNKHGMDFMDEILGLGAAKHCDAIAIHPYRQSTPEESDLVGDLRHIAEMAERHGARRKLWFTEDCWTTQFNGGSSEQRSAMMLPRCYVLSLGTGLVERLLWFRFHDPGIDRFYLEHNCGLCRNDLTPQPSYLAHRTVAVLLDGAQADGEWDVGPNALARCFRTPTERIAAVWCPDGTAPASIYVGAPEVRVVDIMGNERTEKTTDGVLILTAREDMQYLRGLPDQAEARGTPLSASAPPLVRGEKGTLTVRVRNPFANAKHAKVTLAMKGDAPIALTAAAAELDAPANGEKEVPFEVQAAPDAKPGTYAIAATLDLDGHTFALNVPVAVRTAAPTAGPVGRWTFDEGQGATVNDSSGSGNNGTVENAKWVEGKRGKALEFSAAETVVIPDSPSLNLRDEVTLAFWIKVLDKTGTWQFPVGKYEGNICRNYGIYLTPDDLTPRFSASFEGAGAPHTDRGPNVSLPVGEWRHLAVTVSMFEKRMRFYVDGKEELDVPSTEGAMRLTAEPLRIGQGTKGVIDEVDLYPRVLSAEEVAGLAK
ncbi:MAG: LamG-like jellyroll fold domain-containing protein [Planctomycetota bacterium]